MRYKDDTEIKVNIIIIVCIIIIMFIANSCEAVLSEKTYNNGIHEGCGGHWVYETAVGHQYTTSYIYQCDKCGMTAEFTDKY